MKNTFILFTTILLAAVADGERTYTLLDGNDWTLDNIPVLVPHCWNKIDGADGNPALADDTKIYSAVPATSYLRARRIYARPLPAARPGRRYFIRCEGASQKATVVVNGVVIGSHKGSFTAFCFEATAAMKPSGNRLEIEVSNEYDPTIPPASGGFNIHGGLYRSVWFIETDPVCIDPTRDGGPGVRVFPSMDGSVHVEADVSGADDAVVDWEPKKVAAPRLWSPETPVVYTVKVTVRKGEWSDTVEQPFGFRTAEIRKDGFYLNGVRRKVRGVSRHQDLEGMGWEVTAKQEELDVRLIKAMGADGLRLAHYPQGENIYSLCDRYGLMVWSEIPVVNELGGPEFMENARTTLREMIAQHRNHPSVCWWGMWNEIFNCPKPDEAWAARAAEFAPLAAELDSLRPIVAASYKEIGRVSPEALAVLNRSVPNICYNIYPGWYVQPDISNSMKRELDVFFSQNGVTTTALSEYGVGGSVHQHQNPPEKPKTTAMFHPEEWQTKQLADDLRDIEADGRVWGSFVWAMFDFSHDGRREGDRYGILDKGLVTRDRAILKDAYFLYKANWNPEPLLHLCSKRMTQTANAACEVVAFSNAGDVTLKVNGETVGTMAPDSVKRVVFGNVRLAPGENEIVVESGTLRDTAHWTLEIEEPAYAPEGWNLKAREGFAANRFGVFITWGLYSMLGSSRELSPEARKLDREAYERVADGFYPSAFDAREWVSAIKRSGARYVTFVSRHHDGFALWPSKVDKWNVGHCPFKRDIVGELAAACREQGLTLNLYYSLLDWHRPDYTPGVKWICESRYLADQKPNYASYKKYMMGQIRELLDNYHPGAIWFDGEWDHYGKDHGGDFDWGFDEIYDLIHSRHALIANNHHKMIRPKEDIQLFERDLPGVGTSHSKDQPLLNDRPVEQCDITQRRTWGYQITAPFITPQEAVALVARAASKGSNLLLNVGPDASGRLPSKAVEILEATGRWFARNGESIYGTVAGGVGAPDGSVVSTRRGKTLYIHFIDPAVREFTFEFDGETRTVRCPRAPGDTYDVVVPVEETPSCRVDDFPVAGRTGTAIQKAVDAASAAGGGRVVLSNGVYESGTIYLKSNVELHLEEGAVLRGAADSAAYDDVDDPRIGRVPERSRKAFIVCFDGENVAITGKGTIDGQGVAFYDAFSAAGRRHFAKPAAPRPRMVQFFNCRRVRFEGATFKDSLGWTFWLRACEDVEVSSINVEGDQRMINNDGLHIDACRNVRVGDSRFKTGDDCIVMRANVNKDGCGALCENLVVSNCFLDSSCQAVRLGCPSDGTIRHALFRDLTIRGVNGVLSKHPLRYLHTGSCGGFAMEDMVFERCDIETERCPILFDVDPGIKLASFGHTVFRDMKVKGGRSVVLRGNAASPLENVAFERCVFDCAVSNAFDIHAVKNLSFGGTTVSTALPGAESFDWNWQGGCWEEDMCVDSTDGGQNVVMGVLRGRGRKGWLARHEATLETIKNGPGHYDIVMVGDSITDLWQHPRPGGKEVAERYFNKWNMLNLGVMGDLVENIIWRLENGEADGYAAKVVMVLAGTNNIGKGASGEEIAAATERLVELLRTKHPEARIVLLPILPRDDRRKSPDAAARIAKANELSRKLVDGKTVFGLDFSQRLLGEDGAIDAALFKNDRLHLNASGYGVWAEAALPVFEKLLSTPPAPLLPEEPIAKPTRR